MCWMDCEMLSDPTGKFELFVDLVQQQVILFSDHTMTVTAISCEYLEAYIIYLQIKKGISFEQGKFNLNYLF